MNETKCCENGDAKGFTRRQLLGFAGWGAFFATLGASLIASVRFVFPRVLFEPPLTFKIGLPENFRSDKNADEHKVLFVDERWKDSKRAWIVREKDRIYAMFTRCTHLGCTPNWFPNDRIFKCPCHGSQYYSNGKNFAGPAPRPLDRFAISIADDGQILVDMSKLYSSKEFSDPGSYLKV